MIFVKYTVKGFPFPFNQHIFHVRFDFTDKVSYFTRLALRNPFFSRVQAWLKVSQARRKC